MNEFDSRDFETPPCILTDKINHEEYPWGKYHLNLVSPISVAKCKDTGMLYLCPRPNKKNREAMLTGTLPHALREYGEHVYNYASVDRLRAADFEERLSYLSKIFPGKGRSILDIGTSSGNFMEVAIRHGWKAVGLEPFPDDVAHCIKKGLDVTLGMAESLPYHDNAFDVVHASHVFEHLENPLTAAKEAWRVLKPGGLLFIEVPNQLDNFGFRRDVLFRNVRQRKRSIASIHHLWFFGRRTLYALYNKALFVDISILNKHHKTFGGWRMPFSFISKTLSSMFYGTYIIRGIGRKPY